jgi:NAD(P)-dependent dehydrogenase (short-subunit alcohol dehydrogenase family)
VSIEAGPEAPAALVTGVSTGIGNGILRELARAGWHVFGSVRKPQDAERLSQEMGASYTPLIFDVTDSAALSRAAQEVEQALRGRKLAGLVNNAGIAVPGPLLELPLAELRRQLEVNLVSVLGVTQAFFPLLRTSSDAGGRPARIVNISSVAGRIAAPFLGPYAAAKHGVQGLSDSLRRECLLNGVDVVVIDPAAVSTRIWDKAEALDVTPYAKSPYREPMLRMRDAMVANGRRGSPPEAIGRLVVKVLEARRPRARYLVGRGSAGIWIITHFAGRRLADRFFGRALGLAPHPAPTRQPAKGS